MQVSKIEIEELGVIVTKEHTGYTLFSREGENLVAYQMVDGHHIVIPTEDAAVTLDDTQLVVERIAQALGDSNRKTRFLVAKAIWDWAREE